MRSLISRAQGGPEILPLPGGDPLSIASLARDVSQRYLIWDAFVGGQRRIVANPLVLPAAMHEAAVRAAETVAGAVGRVAARAQVDETEREAYLVSDDVCSLSLASFEAGDLASLVRVDVVPAVRGIWGGPGGGFWAHGTHGHGGG